MQIACILKISFIRHLDMNQKQMHTNEKVQNIIKIKIIENIEKQYQT